jgi:tRNA A37 N6-isopentenylltransferase MiaA
MPLDRARRYNPVFGPPGTGKTHLAVALADALPGAIQRLICSSADTADARARERERKRKRKRALPNIGEAKESASGLLRAQTAICTL